MNARFVIGTRNKPNGGSLGEKTSRPLLESRDHYSFCYFYNIQWYYGWIASKQQKTVKLDHPDPEFLHLLGSKETVLCECSTSTCSLDVGIVPLQLANLTKTLVTLTWLRNT